VRETYYRSANLHVYGVRSFATGRVVITFAPVTFPADLDQPGFGEAFLRKHGIDAVHVVPASNAWYQYPDMPDALEAVATRTSHYPCRIAYGSSMGGYAAINFSAHLDVHRIIAISPQFSIDPKKLPDDRRWRHEAERIDFLHDHIAELRPASRQTYVVYDNQNALDSQHVARIARSVALTEVGLEFAGHPAGGALVETGLLSRMVRQMIAGDFDAPTLVAEFAARSPATAAYFANQAATLPENQVQEKLHLMRRVVELQPGGVYSHQLSDLLSRSGAHDEALAIQRSLIAAYGDSAELNYALALTLERAGRLSEATEAARAALARAPDSATLWLLCGRLLSASGQPGEAETYLRKAIELAPSAPEATFRLSRLLGQQGRRAEALEAALAAVERAPDRAGYHEHLGRLRVAVGDWRSAESAFARATNLDPKRADLLLLLSLVRLRRLRPSSAFGAAWSALRLMSCSFGHAPQPTNSDPVK
jgi:tetratricopeptide (TPR) repeat protein